MIDYFFYYIGLSISVLATIAATMTISMYLLEFAWNRVHSWRKISNIHRAISFYEKHHGKEQANDE